VLWKLQKGKVYPRTGHEGLEGDSFFNLSSSWGWVVNAMPRLLFPRKDLVPMNRRLGAPQGTSGQVWKNSPFTRFDPKTVQPMVSCYTGHTVIATSINFF